MSNEETKPTPFAAPREKILVADDEQDIRLLVNFHLTRAGYDVLSASNGQEALELALKEKPDMAILDRMMPELDGVEVCKRLRKINPGMYIMMLTALDSEDQKVIGLESGADDYVTKPFSGRELVARVRAIIRRNKLVPVENFPAIEATPAKNGLAVSAKNGLYIDQERRQVFIDGQEVELTKLEFDLLKFLQSNAGLVFSRDQLLEKVWNYDYFGDGRVVDVHMARLRKKLEDHPGKPQFIQTIRGVGYKFISKG